MVHWTEFLPEAGRQAKFFARQQSIKFEQIENAKELVEQLTRQYDDEEKLIIEAIKDQWTEREIKRAKKQAELAALS